MDTGTGPWKLIVTIAFIGIFAGFWFSEASKYSLGKSLNMEYRSFLPVMCTLSIDRIEEARRSAEAYFWQGSVRLDVHSITTARTQHFHEIVRPDGTAYLWPENSDFGDIQRSALQYDQLAGVPATKDWFCYPWVFIDFNLFDPPANVQFE